MSGHDAAPAAGAHGHGPAPEATPEELSRRGFLTKISLAATAGVAGLIGVPIVVYLLGPLIQPTEQQWRAVGMVDEFAVGQTALVSFEEPSPLKWAGQTALTAAYLRRNSADPTAPQAFTAFAVNCTHLGCPVNWQPDARIFLCPCHGGVYYADGQVAAGPPPHPLFQYDTRVVDGRVELKTRPLPVARAAPGPPRPGLGQAREGGAA
ncbi:MAG TPA: ubiquinol-cytochrome c reductase iron-sulfur subunit [Thermomicrobiales bacterium]|nr:ubiquinol-cytochrome c reductase iron-sulfur subunit [Thermomicrobiales bacterium]